MSDEVKTKISLQCSCGGTTEAIISAGQQTAIEECACGKILLWSDGKVTVQDKQPAPREAPAVLGISVSDSAKTSEHIS